MATPTAEATGFAPGTALSTVGFGSFDDAVRLADGSLHGLMASGGTRGEGA